MTKKNMPTETLRFIDLFAGLGGFHLALKELGHECVFASEISEELADLYELNHGLRPSGDIRNIAIDAIPEHDILCAGFPCQPFSKAGRQMGFDCPQWGMLFHSIVEILRFHQPEYVVIENVPNILRHRGGETRLNIIGKLQLEGYEVRDSLLSPHQFGIPQIRERAFIVGRRSGMKDFSWPECSNNPDLSIASVLEPNPSDARQLSPTYINYLEVWQEFLDIFPKNEEIPSFPIWTMEFRADYPYVKRSPAGHGFTKLGRFKGIYGYPLKGLTEEDVVDTLPAYARYSEPHFPKWKIKFIRQNREFYRKHKSWLDGWLPKVMDFPASFQKFEWNCKGEERNLWQHVIQFRASGIRVKRSATAPSLVAMTSSQVPVIPWEKRYMTIRECARLQSMDTLILPKTRTAAFRALGNAVNVEVARRVCQQLVNVDAIKASDVIDLSSVNKRYKTDSNSSTETLHLNRVA